MLRLFNPSLVSHTMLFVGLVSLPEMRSLEEDVQSQPHFSAEDLFGAKEQGAEGDAEEDAEEHSEGEWVLDDQNVDIKIC